MEELDSTRSVLARAVDCAVTWHGGQLRKGTTVPYVAHLLAVAALVLEAGGTLDVHAPAAVLHDAVEDTDATVEQIEELFGPSIAAIVEGCSDAQDPAQKPPWEERKRAYLAHLTAASPDVVIVSLADKLHNCSAITEDYRRLGPELWARFKVGAPGQLWYYNSLAQVYESRRNELSPEANGVLDRLVDELDALTTLIEAAEPGSLSESQAFAAKLGD